MDLTYATVGTIDVKNITLQIKKNIKNMFFTFIKKTLKHS